MGRLKLYFNRPNFVKWFKKFLSDLKIYFRIWKDSIVIFVVSLIFFTFTAIYSLVTSSFTETMPLSLGDFKAHFILVIINHSHSIRLLMLWSSGFQMFNPEPSVFYILSVSAFIFSFNRYWKEQECKRQLFSTYPGLSKCLLIFRCETVS